MADQRTIVVNNTTNFNLRIGRGEQQPAARTLINQGQLGNFTGTVGWDYIVYLNDDQPVYPFTMTQNLTRINIIGGTPETITVQEIN